MKKSVFTLLILGIVPLLSAQNLDRISISSGGATTNEVSYVIGETFNFTMSDDADLTIETGTQGSEDDTGGDNNYTIIKEMAETHPLQCYPNPATDYIYIKTGIETNSQIFLQVYDINGKLIRREKTNTGELLKVNVQHLSPGTYFISLINNSYEIIGSIKFNKQ
jgi:hypothetical protein